MCMKAPPVSSAIPMAAQKTSMWTEAILPTEIQKDRI